MTSAQVRGSGTGPRTGSGPGATVCADQSAAIYSGPVRNQTPLWVAALLEAQGHLNRDGVGRKLRVGVCRRCKAKVLRGLDDDRCAEAATVDPDPLDSLGETRALLAGANTYRVWKVTGGYELTRRFDLHIRGTPADKCPDPILADHQCNGETLW